MTKLLRARGGLRRVPAVWVGWAIARLCLAVLIKLNHEPRGDLFYYHVAIFGSNPQDMTEYPHAGTWPTYLAAWLGGSEIMAFMFVFALFCLACDAAFLAALLHRHDTRPTAFAAAWFWVLFGLAAGHVFLMRLDIFPGLAVGFAALVIHRWPVLSSSLIALACAMKLWPGVLAAGLVGRATNARAWLRLLTFGVSLVAFAGITLLSGGWERLTSPLDYQNVRGLQIESVAATPYMWDAYRHPAAYELGMAPSKSFEITGAGTDGALQATTWAMGIVIAFALLWALYRFIWGGWSPRTTISWAAVVVLGLIVTNKVFSPQYIIWFGPLIAVALRTTTPGSARRKVVASLGVMTVVCAGLGTYIYPFGYDYLWNFVGEQLAPVAALVARNVLVVAMFVFTLVWWVLELRAQVLERREIKELGQPGGAAQPEGAHERAQA